MMMGLFLLLAMIILRAEVIRQSPIVGGTAPGFHAELIRGRVLGLRAVTLSKLRGRTVALLFLRGTGESVSWANWLATMERTQPDSFVVIGIREGRRAFRQSPQVQVVDPGGSLERLYAVTSLPTLVWISPKGTVAARESGQASKGALQRDFYTAGQ